jgi:hypothetical protein
VFLYCIRELRQEFVNKEQPDKFTCALILKPCENIIMNRPEIVGLYIRTCDITSKINKLYILIFLIFSNHVLVLIFKKTLWGGGR